MESADNTLLAQWRQGDADAGNELARRYCRPILRFFTNKAPQSAEDLMQKTFMACLTNGTPADEVRSFRAFLFGIARIQLLRHAEGRGQTPNVDLVSHISDVAPGTTPTQRVARSLSRDLLIQAIATLSVDEQIALELYYWQDMSVSEVAAALALSEGGTRAKLHRARQRAKQAYSRLSGGETFDWPARG